MTHEKAPDRARILIVDDNVEFRDSTAEILVLAGYETVQAIDLDDAVERLRDEAFDLVLLDLGVDRGGLRLLDRVARLPAVLAISGADEDGPADPRIVAFLGKPIWPVRLLAEVAGCLSSEGEVHGRS